MPRAAGLAAEIRQAFGVEPVLVKGADGVFDVDADGELVYSKYRDGRFPEPAEVIDRLKAKK
ncbi:MAG: Rdx family protein [Betaproteobacteria bacterium]